MGQRPLNELVELLKDESEVLDRLLGLLLDQRRLIPAGKPDEFLINLDHQERLILELERLESKRLGLIQSLGRELGLGPERYTLDGLIEADPDHRSLFHPLRERLMYLVQKVMEVNQGNQYLIGRFLGLVRQSIQLLFGLDAGGFYAPSGKLSGGQGQLRKAIDKRV